MSKFSPKLAKTHETGKYRPASPIKRDRLHVGLNRNFPFTKDYLFHNNFRCCVAHALNVDAGSERF